MKIELYKSVRPQAGEPYVITQGWGGNGDFYKANGIDILGHNGLDILLDYRQPVYAAHDGIVLRKEVDDKGGIGLHIRTKEKFDFEGKQVYFKTIYWHLAEILVNEGDGVKQGQVVALGDSTGFSTNHHLHFGLKPLKDDFTLLLPNNGYGGAIDPTPYFVKEDMKHVLINGDQYLLYPPLKIAISIANVSELNKLIFRGLTTLPDSASSSMLEGYWVISGIETKELKDIFNL